MSTRHTFAAALVVLAIVATLWPVAIAQDKKPEASEADASCNRMPADADERERKIYDALAKPVEVDFEEKPLKDVVVKLAQTSGIQIQFDEKALSEAAVATDTPITKRLHGISLRAALRHMLRPQQLTYTIRDSVLLITSQSDAENVLVVRTHPVGDLVTDANGRTDFVPLIELMGHIVAPTTWDEVGGPGSVQSLEPGMLVVSQTDEVQAELEGLFTTLRQVRDLQKKSPGGAPVSLCDDSPTQVIREALDRTISLEFEETPLAELVEKIRHEAKIQILFDEKALTEAAVATDVPVTRNFKNLPLRDALNLLLRPLTLTHIPHEEVLLITSQTEAENRLLTRLYPVQDLVRQIPADESRSGTVEYDFDPLMDTIGATIAPQTWDMVGGPGSVQGYDASIALVVSQTDEVHQSLEKLLAQVRRVAKEKANESPSPSTGAKPILRVYTLHERIVPQSLEKTPQPAPLKDADKQSSNAPTPAAKEGETRLQLSTINFGTIAGRGNTAGRAADTSIAVPPQGVPPQEAEELIRSLVQPQSWNEPGVFIRPTKSRLLVQHSLAVHRQVAKLLERLGPWQEENDGLLLMQSPSGSRRRNSGFCLGTGFHGPTASFGP